MHAIMFAYRVPFWLTFMFDTMFDANCFTRIQLLEPREKSESRHITTSIVRYSVQGPRIAVSFIAIINDVFEEELLTDIKLISTPITRQHDGITTSIFKANLVFCRAVVIFPIGRYIGT